MRDVTSFVRPAVMPRAVSSRRELDVEVLYAQHARYVAGIVHRILGRGDGDVDDIVQETFSDAFEGISGIENVAAARASLVTVAVRRTHRFLARRRRRALFAFAAMGFLPRTSDPRHRQPVDDLYDVLDRVPESLRIPWVLHRIEHMSLPETAAACEISLATAKRRIAEAEERIERRLGRTTP